MNSGRAAKLKYHPDDIAQLDLMGYLERNESRFFRAGSYDAIELAGMIATEALTLGAGQVQIQSDGEWLTVAADQDWLEDQEYEAFHAITPFPQAGPNSMLAEILTFAFSAGVITATRAESKVIKGDTTAPTRPVDRDIARTVSFKRQRGSRLAE
ncbi:hypothetical protein ACWGH3_26625 [Streptomyces sp. NPDC054884]|uniref:hypothetical protein n=1 Tax=Streptomyces sp. ME08-AFT2 TaxID=3028683 RepID=UPI0029A28ABF|nr:hypothetical protein [Streptomyces sp. ME08-AFT2]MDX3311450.1 hypothetical protein [Streptomyces sp. ME08-AFT2]